MQQTDGPQPVEDRPDETCGGKSPVAVSMLSGVISAV